MNPLYAAVSIGALCMCLLMVFRTRKMLRVRSPGNLQPGQISDWHVWVWRVIASMAALVSLGLVYISLAVV